MSFPSTTLLELLASGKDIICTDAARRKEPIENVVRDTKDQYLDHTKELEPYVELNGLSTGILLLDAKVFEKMKKPYFKYEYDGETFLGEDYYFGKEAKRLGYKCYCHTKLSPKIGHTGDKTYFVDSKKS
jgi:choline kinase